MSAILFSFLVLWKVVTTTTTVVVTTMAKTPTITAARARSTPMKNKFHYILKVNLMSFHESANLFSFLMMWKVVITTAKVVVTTIAKTT
jgi:hypothetical protein